VVVEAAFVVIIIASVIAVEPSIVMEANIAAAEVGSTATMVV